ncbi:MAG: hypothetical protein WA777_11250 [Rhodanobacter sp.]
MLGKTKMKRILALFTAALFVTAPHAAFAGQISAELSQPDNHELDPVATVTKDGYRYELTEFSCVRDAQLQAEGTTAQERSYARWLTKQAAAHPASKYFTRYAGSALDLSGCYEHRAHGIRVYLRGETQPIDVDAPIMPCDPAVVQLRVCAPGPMPAPMPMPEWSPDTSLSEKLVNTLNSQADAAYAERFLFEGRPAVLWPTTCTLAAQMQGSEMNGSRDYPFIRWQLSQSGKLLTVLRADGTYSEGCYVRTANGIRIWSFEQKEPFDLNWQ